ncbi:TolC family protein [Xanthobacter sp. VNH20]|uniref:TolC family protein n=1 Tax=Xanthobacter TaxID=279 RepID=UPI0032B428CC
MSFRARALALGAAIALLHAMPSLAASPRPLTLAQALSSALNANPRLTVAERDIGMAGGRSLQATFLPNPTLMAEVDNAFGSGSYQGLDLAEQTLQVSQLVELGGKREARIAAASAGVGVARWEREAVRLQVLADTTAAFVTVLSAQRRLDILKAQVGAIERWTPLLQKRVEAGASSPAEISRAKVAADLARIELERATVSLVTARRELALLMGLKEARFGAVTGNLVRVGMPPSLNIILRSAQENPQLTRFTALKAQRSAEVSGARAKAVPDVSLGIGYRHYNETADSGMRFTLTMPLPIFDQNQGGIIEANEALRRAEAEEAVVRSALISQVGRAYDTLKASFDEVEILRGTTIPDAKNAFQGIESGYSEGRYTLLELLDAQSSLTDTSLRELDALVSYHSALAVLEGLTGRPVAFAKGKSK